MKVATDIDYGDFDLEISFSANLDPKNYFDELIGITVVSVKISTIIYDDEDSDDGVKTDVGQLVFYIHSFEHHDIYSSLDAAGETEPFFILFDRNECIKRKYLKKMESEWEYLSINANERISELVIMIQAEIKPNYRGKGIFEEAFIRAMNILRLNRTETLLLFKSYPLQHGGISKEEIDMKLLKKDSKKLMNYYESLGFLLLDKLDDGYLMCWMTDRFLVKERD